jgi:hypothetical protein
MVLGMTHGEVGIVLFVFALVYGAQVVPKLGARLGNWISRRTS